MKRVFRVLVWIAFAFLMLEGLMLERSSSHLQEARRLASEHRILEAAREYQASIGDFAPFNPFSSSAVTELEILAEKERTRNSQLAFDLQDRLLRSIRGCRSFYQPYRKVLQRHRNSHESPG